jgi:signal transduction histidine kinase
LIPQITFAATGAGGIAFANDQWLSYSGQQFEQALGFGFMEHVHIEDLKRCRIPAEILAPMLATHPIAEDGNCGSSTNVSEFLSDATLTDPRPALSRESSSGSSNAEMTAELLELAKGSKDGEYRWHLVRCVAIDNINLGAGEGSWFGSCTDINDHKELEQKLKEAMDSKTRFLSNMSHKIRTPLIGISGMINFLQDTPLNDEQQDYCSTIASSAESLLEIINDILDLSKVDAGMMKLTHEWFHTRSLIEEVNELVSSLAISKRLELNYVVDDEVPHWLKGDRVRIRQVLLNVIGNAVKFTAQGEVFCRCRVCHGENVKLDETEVMLAFEVVDTGCGFSKEDAGVMFKPFSQIGQRQYDGSGLGLVISRQLAELHGGKLEGRGEPNKGSIFTLPQSSLCRPMQIILH